MASRDLSRKHFLHLCGGALALGVAGCDSGGDGGTDSGGSTGATTSTSTDPTNGTDPSQGTDPASTTDPSGGTDGTSTTTDPTGGTSGGSSSGGSTSGEGSTGRGSTGEPSTSDTTSSEESTSSPSTTGDKTCAAGVTDVAIDVHGGHGITIDADQLQPGTPLSDLDITGASGHSHAIDLSADDVDALLAGEEVTVSSTMAAGHIHQVTLGCV